jgi:hypothetical protein
MGAPPALAIPEIGYGTAREVTRRVAAHPHDIFVAVAFTVRDATPTTGARDSPARRSRQVMVLRRANSFDDGCRVGLALFSVAAATVEPHVDVGFDFVEVMTPPSTSAAPNPADPTSIEVALTLHSAESSVRGNLLVDTSRRSSSPRRPPSSIRGSATSTRCSLTRQLERTRRVLAGVIEQTRAAATAHTTRGAIAACRTTVDQPISRVTAALP